MLSSLVKGVSLCAIVFFILPKANGQQFSISTPVINTCSGVLEDTGGPGGEYGNNESFTTTICPDTVGGELTLTWSVFNLSIVGSQNSWDRIEMWDGNSTSANYLGSYTGSSLSGLTASATIYNTSGCLTIRFTSNGVGTGNFAASISCIGGSNTCNQPTAISSTAISDTTILCLGDTLFLDGSNSIPYGGTTITEWQWNTGVMAPFVTSSPIDTLVLTEAGVIALQLLVTSDENCTSTISEPQNILVSGPVSFLGTITPETVCIPATVDLFGNATLDPFVQVSYTGAQYGPGIFLPDDVGVILTSTAVYTNASVGSTVTDPAELGDICLNMEHSYMGDLFVQLECPNGQFVNLHEQGGGGTFLGAANDSDTSAEPVPGICWEYCFNTNPDHGSWADCAQFGPTPNVTTSSTGSALVAGSYTPVTALTSLIGCPVNGEWKMKFTDLWGGDNGFLCSWSISGFPQEIDSSYVSLSATLDLQNPALTNWTGPATTPSATLPIIATTQITNLGPNTYTFTVKDSYGCRFDTTVTIVGSDTIEFTLVQIDGVIYAPDGLGTYEWSFNGAVLSNEVSSSIAVVGSGLYAVNILTSNGCAGTDSIMGYQPMGISEFFDPTPLRIIPNPTNGTFRLQLDRIEGNSCTLELCDVTGRLVLAEQYSRWSATETIQAGHLNQGTYFIQVVSVDERFVGKVILER
ncbi:MAG: T9SS type A sorting domain-containing protein [Flavobacteriales bacterium]|nr:T9SS type A sorting domain-containing protein [Flavobacteriales bacterium]MBK7298289.1 T9SS type A sorting domain-containing protein [Flavobacteriales bacterium]